MQVFPDSETGTGFFKTFWKYMRRGVISLVLFFLLIHLGIFAISYFSDESGSPITFALSKISYDFVVVTVFFVGFLSFVLSWSIAYWKYYRKLYKKRTFVLGWLLASTMITVGTVLHMLTADAGSLPHSPLAQIVLLVSVLVIFGLIGGGMSMGFALLAILIAAPNWTMWIDPEDLSPIDHDES